MQFKSSLHYPCYRPDATELEHQARRGWRPHTMIISPPQSKFAEPGLFILWYREPLYRPWADIAKALICSAAVAAVTFLFLWLCALRGTP
jgi:hypothetical protein